ncbi:MAG: flagellin lysine-N-methylase [Lachnospiraceae bacterium]|nr:flagellin lysine-N-methylase [Lachnospiraceae bacterium]
MKIRKPKYYDEFQCIGGACQDTCCAGWEIEIDEETAERYDRIDGEIGNRLKENITKTEEEVYFNLQEGKRCPFLNNENLCDLIVELGEGVLCDICREHPRHYQWFGDYTEVGIGLCCEEAGRLLFQSPEKLEMVLEETVEEDVLPDVLETIEDNSQTGDAEEQEYIELLLQARETAYSIMQNRDMSIKERLILLLQYGEELQEAWDVDDYESIRFATGVYSNPDAFVSAWKQMEVICGLQTKDSVEGEHIELEDAICEQWKDLLTLFHDMESLDDTWPARIENLLQQLPELLNARTGFAEYYPNARYEYEHFAVYLLYRYFMEALFDGDILGKVKFVAVSVMLLELMDVETYGREQAFTLWSRIQNAKQYSKEIEYCTENMEAFAEKSWQEECLSITVLIEMLQ